MTPAIVAVVIPCFRVGARVLDVLARIGDNVDQIYLVDDACPDKTADIVESQAQDPRLRILRHADNMGVGGATRTGMLAAMASGAKIIVKLDGDGQMDPADIPALIAPIVKGDADYTKGNRFFAISYLKTMPKTRMLANAALSFAAKLASGYWTVFDPANGFIAIHADVLRALPLKDVEPRYFFETDLLCRLNLLRAHVIDVPLRARYGDETSTLSMHLQIAPFAAGLVRNFVRRILYSYFLRDFSVGSLYLLLGVPLFLFGGIFGLHQWRTNLALDVATPAGSVMLAALPIIIGFQLILSFLAFDIATTPRHPIHDLLTALDDETGRGDQPSSPS